MCRKFKSVWLDPTIFPSWRVIPPDRMVTRYEKVILVHEHSGEGPGGRST